jgi:protein SCO1/2
MDHGTYLYLMDEGKFVLGLDADTPCEHLAEAVRGAIAKAREHASHQGRTNAMSGS